MPEESLVARLRALASAGFVGRFLPLRDGSDPCPGGLAPLLREAADALERAPLSFLDMDEAGVARIERAIWESGREAGNITGEESWRSYRAECKGQARAVLSELRKMAGEKEGEA